MKLRMGTRGSALALAQSGRFARDLEAANPGLAVEAVVIKTSGDLFAAANPQAEVAPAGGKGLFVKEIEEALLRGDVDFAVHSSKDLPAVLAPGLRVAAYPRREDPRDALIGLPLSALKSGHRVASSSLRRRLQLRARVPGLETCPIRGNVDTRLRRLAEGAADALVLAVAGLKRLGRADVPHEPIPVDVVVPAPGQGALAVEARDGRSDAAAALARLDDAQTRLEVECERAFMAAMGGGCSTPLGALARAAGGSVEFRVFYAEPDGSRPFAERFEWPVDGLGERARALAARVQGR